MFSFIILIEKLSDVLKTLLWTSVWRTHAQVPLCGLSDRSLIHLGLHPIFSLKQHHSCCRCSLCYHSWSCLHSPYHPDVTAASPCPKKSPSCKGGYPSCINSKTKSRSWTPWWSPWAPLSLSEPPLNLTPLSHGWRLRPPLLLPQVHTTGLILELSLKLSPTLRFAPLPLSLTHGF